MSEYQYYEFQAVDRPLNQREMDELRALSSRATITPTRFVNVYNWGSFRDVEPPTPLELHSLSAPLRVGRFSAHR